MIRFVLSLASFVSFGLCRLDTRNSIGIRRRHSSRGRDNHRHCGDLVTSATVLSRVVGREWECCTRYERVGGASRRTRAAPSTQNLDASPNEADWNVALFAPEVSNGTDDGASVSRNIWLDRRAFYN